MAEDGSPAADHQTAASPAEPDPAADGVAPSEPVAEPAAVVHVDAPTTGEPVDQPVEEPAAPNSDQPEPPKSIAMAIEPDKSLVVSEPVTDAPSGPETPGTGEGVSAEPTAPSPSSDPVAGGHPSSLGDTAAGDAVPAPEEVGSTGSAADTPTPDIATDAPAADEPFAAAEDSPPGEGTGENDTEEGPTADGAAASIDAEALAESDDDDQDVPDADNTETADVEPPDDDATEDETYETVGGDEAEETQLKRRMLHNRLSRSYKIQEVIKRRQIMLVQVNKEERGNKGAALTSYLSLAGRYCVLMPNSPKGGGISRKIANPKDRKKMKEILSDLDVPEGMAVILRTAGLERTKAEIKRDFEYLMRLWDSIRETTLQSTAPALIHEEANLIKRAIRDLYTRDVDEVLVAGEEGYRIAKDFMKMLMPSHAKKVQQYRDPIPLLQRYQVESQIDALHNPTVQLKSGGYIVINPTEALVAVDVNSGRSTKERNIEETAYKTNLEAAEEIARQLRLRDLAGLIVIDFIDMEEDRHNTAVERKLKEAMKQDRARVQIGRISGFGLLELSRQRLRPSLMEAHFEVCPMCKGTGVIRSLPSASLTLLRAIEEEGLRGRASEITVQTPTAIALYILNQKRDALLEIEARYGMRVQIDGDDTIQHPDYRIHKSKARTEEDATPAVDAARLFDDRAALPDLVEEDEPDADGPEAADAEDGEVSDDERGKRRRRRRRRRGRDRDGDDQADLSSDDGDNGDTDSNGADDPQNASDADDPAVEDGDSATDGRRRRGRRGGRRRGGLRREGEEVGTDGAASPDEPAVADGDASEAVAAETIAADDEPPAEAPKRRRVRRRRRSTTDTVVEAEGASDTAAAAPAVAEASGDPEEGEPLGDDPDAPAPLTDPGSETAASPAPETPADIQADGEVVIETVATGVGEGEDTPVDAVPEAVEPSSSDDGVAAVNQPPEKPRRGWWQRLTGS